MSEIRGLTIEELNKFLNPSDERLQQADLTPYLDAAAVLAAFDPFNLYPARSDSISDRGRVLDLLIPKSETLPQSGLWTLRLIERREALRRLASRSKMLAARSANQGSLPSSIQQMVDYILAGKRISLDSMSREDVAALLIVLPWFDGILTGLPGANACRKALAEADFLAPMRRLAEERFVGRKAELAQLHQFVFGPLQPSPLFIYGTGGVGKSTLLARFILTQLVPQDVPLAYIDLDRPTIRPEQPLTIVVDVANQLQPQLGLEQLAVDAFNKELTYALGRQEQSRHLESVMPALPDTIAFQESVRRWLGGKTAVLIVDTMEEAQFLGPEVMWSLTDFLLRLHHSSGMRVILLGRTLPEEFTSQAFQQFPGQLVEDLQLAQLPSSYRPINLGELDNVSARQLLLNLLRLSGSMPLTRVELDEVVGIVGSNPMCLHLAARLLLHEGIAEFRANRSEFMAKLKAEKIQALLYCRILLNVHDEQVRKVAYPGLIVRRITPEVIRNVLAEPCGLSLPPTRDEYQIFDDLRREAALVYIDRSDGSLRHRADVRRAMLADLTDHVDVEVIASIDAKAIAYYEKQTGGTSRAEELYHRLRRQEPEDKLNGRWLPEAAEFLKNAGDELPAQQRLWLAGHLGVTLDDSVREAASQEAWENQVATAVDRYLLARSPNKALALLRERPARLPRSRLYNLETETLRFLGDTKEALRVARAGVEAAGRAGAIDMALELLCKMAIVEESSLNLESAAVLLSEAAGVAAHSTNWMLQLTVIIANLRVQRRLRPDASEELRALRTSALRFITPGLLQNLRSRPVLLRETAAELGGFDAQIAGTSIETLGFEVASYEQARALGGALLRLKQSGGLDPDQSSALFKSIDRFAESQFDPSMIRSWVKEVVTGSDTRELGSILKQTTDLDALAAFDDYFKRSNDEAHSLEAIVLPKMRPVMLVGRGGAFDAFEDPWAHINAPDIRARISRLLPSVGRIELPHSPMIPYGGTGFVVGKDLLMTARHAAQLFSQGVGLRVRYQPGGAAVDFGREFDAPEGDRSKMAAVIGVEMIHPYWDMALLRVEGLPRDRALRLSVRSTEELEDRDVIVIGYPAKDERNDLAIQDELFGGIYNVKRLQVGKVRSSSQVRSFDHIVKVLVHDASTLGGNAGSPVIDLATGDVLGLHFAGEYLKGNYAVPMFELARDPRVAPLLNFAGSLPFTNEWESAWQAAEKHQSAQPERVQKNKPSGGAGKS